jgi:biopolymer transport protein ExbD
MDFELNLASIIDCFTVLITYLLVSASFLAIGMLDVSVAAQGTPQNAPPPNEPPPLVVSLELAAAQTLKIHTSGAETQEYPLPPANGAYDLAGMTAQLKKFKEKYPKLDSAMVTADDAVEYREVVKTIEEARVSLANVALGTGDKGQWAQ